MLGNITLCKYPSIIILNLYWDNAIQMQSSTWSNYKHHNMFKFLVGRTPNGAISFVSQL